MAANGILLTKQTWAMAAASISTAEALKVETIHTRRSVVWTNWSPEAMTPRRWLTLAAAQTRSSSSAIFVSAGEMWTGSPG